MANFLQDSKGNNSSTRLLGCLWFIGVLTSWAYLVIKTSAMPEIPQSILAILGMVATWLATNKHIETKAQDANS